MRAVLVLIITLYLIVGHTEVVGANGRVCSSIGGGTAPWDVRGGLSHLFGKASLPPLPHPSPSRPPSSHLEALLLLLGRLLDSLGLVPSLVRDYLVDDGVFLVEQRSSWPEAEAEVNAVNTSPVVVMHTRMSPLPEYLCSRVLSGKWNWRYIRTLMMASWPWPSALPESMVVPEWLSLPMLLFPGSLSLTDMCNSCLGHGRLDRNFNSSISFSSSSSSSSSDAGLWCASDQCASLSDTRSAADESSSSPSCKVVVDPTSSVCITPAGGEKASKAIRISYSTTAHTPAFLLSQGGTDGDDADTGTGTALMITDYRSPSALMKRMVAFMSPPVLREVLQATLPEEHFPVLYQIPLRPVALVVGALLVTHYEAVAASSLLHHALAAAVGGASSLFVLGSTWSVIMAVVRLVFPVMGRMVSLAGTAVVTLPLLVAVVPSLSWVSSAVAETRAAIAAAHSAVGLPFWLVCSMISLVLLRVFDIFGPGTGGRLYLRVYLRLSGLVCLYLASSSTALSLLLVMAGVVGLDHLHFMVQTLYFYCTGTDLLALRGSFLTREEFEASGQLHTKRGLEALRTYLQSGGAGSKVTNVDTYADLFVEAGRTESARLIQRFAEGGYPGVPYTRCSMPLRKREWSEGGERRAMGGRSWCGFFARVLLGGAGLCIFIGVCLDKCTLETDQL